MRPFRGYNEGSMSKWAAIRAVLKIYKWRLLLLALAVLLAVVARNYTIAEGDNAQPPGGGIPNPNIDPL
jgi:hypothetical protein